MRRVLLVGSSGSGKSTLAREVAGRLAVPHVELDALFHGPRWTPRPSFAADVEATTSLPSWVVDGNYAAVRDLLWSRAEMVVWLDLPRLQVEYQPRRGPRPPRLARALVNAAGSATARASALADR